MTENRVALIIANYRYEDAELRQLVAPAQDAEALARVLKDPTIGGFEIQLYLNEPSYKVRQRIDAFFTDPQRKRDDLLLLYFSGHGIKDEDGRLYLATIDTQRKLPRSTAVSANFVSEVMLRSRPRRQVLLLDCCYSGAFARGMLAKSDQRVGTKEHFEGRGRIVLTASDAMQYAFEGDRVFGKGKRSVFTHNLVQGLESGEADLDQDGHITLDELYDYVHDRVIDETPQQRPEKWDLGVQGKIVIAHNPNPVVKPAELPIELRQAVESPFAGVRAGAVWELNHLLRGSDKGLALAAKEALEHLIEDDSHRVSAEAAQSLAVYAGPQRSEVQVYPVRKRTEVEHLAREREERERLAREQAEGKRGVAAEATIEAKKPVGARLLITIGRGVGWGIGGLIGIAPVLWAIWLGTSGSGFGGFDAVIVVIVIVTVGAVGGLITGLALWQMRPRVDLRVPWTYGRLVVLFLLLLGFFGPWTQITGCGTDAQPETWTGVQAVRFLLVTPLIVPIIFLFIVTSLRLGLRRLRNDDEVIWLERIGATTSLAGIVFLLILASNKILWGLWATAAGVLLAPLNLIGELIAARKRRL